MKLHQLRALAAVAETGSIQEASRVLHVTQPALSKAIKELETSVGATLFVRTSKGVQLTPPGQRLVAHARLINENVRRARQDLEDMQGAVASDIVVGVTPVTALLRSVGACLTAFRREHPQARLRVLEMRPAQLLEQLREGTLDFALTSQSLPVDRGLDCTEACRVPTVIAGRKGHALRGATSLDELLDADWMVLDPLSDPQTPLHQLFSANGLPLPARVVECNSMTLALEMSRLDDMLLLLSEESRRSRFLLDTMEFLAIAEPVPDRTISLVVRDRHTLTLAASRLHDALLAALRADFPVAS
ncbi:LysR substrate-binding domain-containing protein [Cupriavidus sp. SW-Y-13]|uniref:LysR substrate-binding domain-containing protein n=1 Tax=Cupriavidus sp. SW-Y-13 TaxID=2653854 RepID=UPI0013657768|nr:LysR substrate-binding domain-containing protein [Cupriavidus sp. SW-Y-13]MWL91464.1 LysR family transcriptional regulator [Cupriavidus sp. SW-Y-13]